MNEEHFGINGISPYPYLGDGSTHLQVPLCPFLPREPKHGPALNHDPYHPSLLPCVLCRCGSSGRKSDSSDAVQLSWAAGRGRGRSMISFVLLYRGCDSPYVQNIVTPDKDLS